LKHNNDTLFSDKSDVYQRSRPGYPAELFTFLAELSPDDNRAWDCACGSGQATQSIASHFERVEATDISLEQLQQAHPIKGVSYTVSKAETTPFADSSFDLISIAQALHWFDQSLFWQEATRVIKPGGIIAAYGYNWPVWGEDLEEVFVESLMKPIMPYFADNNALLWNHYKDIPFPFERLETPDFSMHISYTMDQMFDFFHSFSATRQKMKHQGDEFFQHAYQRVAKVWKNPQVPRKFELDFVCVVGRM